jgi:hypothetical protein
MVIWSLAAGVVGARRLRSELQDQKQQLIRFIEFYQLINLKNQLNK